MNYECCSKSFLWPDHSPAIAGWMMWNWMVSALALGCALVLYDGSPLVPNASTLWDLVDKLRITIFGTGAKWLAVLEEKVNGSHEA